MYRLRNTNDLFLCSWVCTPALQQAGTSGVVFRALYTCVPDPVLGSIEEPGGKCVPGSVHLSMLHWPEEMPGAVA